MHPTLAGAPTPLHNPQASWGAHRPRGPRPRTPSAPQPYTCAPTPAPPQISSSEATALSRPASDFVRRNTQLGRLGTVATVGVQVGEAGREGGRRGVWKGAPWPGGRDVATLAGNGHGHRGGADVLGGGEEGPSWNKVPAEDV